MCSWWFLFHFVAELFVNVLFSCSIFSQTYVVNGTLEGQVSNIKDSKDCIVRRESLVVRDNRVCIELLLDEGARSVSNRQRIKHLSFLLPEEVVYEDTSKCIYYYTDSGKIEVGRVKSFIGLMPYIGLANGVKILSSPTDAKLLVSVGKEAHGIPDTIIHSKEGMEETLGRKCGQCHLLEYIFSHKHWSEEDIIHAFNRMQMEKEERFSEEEQKIIDLFKKYQQGELDKGKLDEFKSLRQIARRDVADITENVYMNSCVPCHSPSNIKDITELYSKRRCKSIVDRMKEKEPSLFLEKDADRLASFLWMTKLRSSKNVELDEGMVE